MGDEWYYAKNGQQMGPVSTEVLTRLATSGQVQPNDLVWREGMPNWAPARTVRAIFPETPQVAPIPVEPAGGYALSPEPAPQPVTAPYEPPARRYEEPDEEYWDRPRRRRSGTNPVLLIVGISVGVLLVVGVIILLIFLLKPGNPRTFDIRAGEKKTFHISFPAGQKAEIWIKSEQNTDIDIFVFDAAGRPVTQDVRFDKDCYVWFVPAQTQTYRIEVVNINLGGRLPVGPNRCTMKWSPP
jgi:hypothetical protein